MSRRRRSIRLPFWCLVSSVVAGIVLYVFGWPHVQARMYPMVSPEDLVIPRAIDVIVFVWCFWVGASVGSFLNVVAWRMPRGESINGRSHCPRCLAQLRARDNLPVFGWLALGGRCYRCRLPISIRYPIVEAAVGLTITAVCIAELYQWSLPGQLVHVHHGPLRAPVVDFEVLTTLLYHSVALSVAWGCGLIRLDGHPLPSKLVLFAIVATVLPILVSPKLMVVPWQTQVAADWRPDGLFVDALLRVASSLAAATIIGRYLARAFCPTADLKLDPLGRSTARLIDLIVILSIPAIVVGWQAFIAVTVIASLIAATAKPILRPPRDALARFAIAMPIAMAFQLVFWRGLHAPDATRADSTGIWYWPSDGGSPWTLLGWVGVVLLIPLWLRDTEPSRPRSSTPQNGQRNPDESEQEQESEQDEPFEERGETRLEEEVQTEVQDEERRHDPTEPGTIS